MTFNLFSQRLARACAVWSILALAAACVEPLSGVAWRDVLDHVASIQNVWPGSRPDAQPVDAAVRSVLPVGEEHARLLQQLKAPGLFLASTDRDRSMSLFPAVRPAALPQPHLVAVVVLRL